MRALTCYPHWAHAIAYLGKRIENRQRPIPAALVGQRIAIHAGAALDCVRDARVIGDALRAGPRWALELAEHWPTERIGSSVVQDAASAWVQDAAGLWRAIATRAIVATAVVRPHEPHPDARLPDWADPHARYWWALSEVRPLAEPVPVRRGQLGLWRLDDVTEAAVIAAGG